MNLELDATSLTHPLAAGDDRVRERATTPPILRSRITPLLLTRLERLGASVAPLLAEHGLPQDAARLPDLSIPLPRFRALVDRLTEAAGDPLLGLHTAAELPAGTYGILEFLVRSAPTAREALTQLVRFAPLYNNLLRFSLAEDGDVAMVEARIDGEPLCLGRQANELVLAVLVALGRQIAGPSWAPEMVSFAHGRPAEADELARFFGTRHLSFGAGYLGVRFRTADLERPVPTRDGALHAFLVREAREELAARGSADPLEPVREAIRVSLRTGEPVVAEVARRLGTSSRTLQRKLMAQGTSFRALNDEVREHLSRLYLHDHSRPLAEVALLLGYADVRAFGRAYKRWTGRSPGAVRAG